jgi:flavin reductase (DIM6/NTAB) family NADH-FMN oxidoreductase RutF
MGTDTSAGRAYSSSSSSSSSTEVMAAAAAVGIGIGMVAGAALSRYYSGNLQSATSWWNTAAKKQSPKSSLASRPAYIPGQTPAPPCPAFGTKIHTFDPTKLTSAYNLMISTVTPRPIALVSTQNPSTGIDNLAPFSYFGCVGHDPPMLAIGFCRNRNGQLKDSIANILESKEFNVQIMSEWYLDAANHSCGGFASTVDEFVESGLTKSKCEVVLRAPRVAEAGVVYECQLVHVQPMTNPESGKPTTEIILAQVVRIHVDDTLLVDNFDPMKPVVDTTKLKPLGRLGGNMYTSLGEIVDIPRPQVA